MKIIALMMALVIPFVAVTIAESRRAEAQTHKQSFESWLQTFRSEAVRQGISPQTVEQALPDFAPIERVIELDGRQPEGRWSFAQYKNNVINQARIDQGRRMMKNHQEKLAVASARFGVAPQYIVALWGIETSYGNNFGSFDIPKALATLAWDGRRAEFFRKELMHALRIIEDGHIRAQDMKGSWAGAMGHNQFMPSSFHNFAVDGNNDGRKDIWSSLPDVFASTANYLAQNGWVTGQRWGRAVKVPEGLTDDFVGLDGKGRLLETWKKLGITRPDGRPIPVVAGMRAWLVAPDGLAGPTFLVYDNYKVIMRWNRSTYFATSVGILADAVANP